MPAAEASETAQPMAKPVTGDLAKQRLPGRGQFGLAARDDEARLQPARLYSCNECRANILQRFAFDSLRDRIDTFEPGANDREIEGNVCGVRPEKPANSGDGGS